jgi:bifunctional UDP-N-acetylglucosamine pyrophosphorylase/glucosamine-1-phosphate N-acetyltransferase
MLNNKIKLVVMCGGIGKRMMPLSRDKSLLPFFGKPLLLHQLSTAQAAGLSDVIIIANQQNIEDIKSITSSLKGIKVECVLQQTTLGMADALLSAADSIQNNPFILVSSNDIVDESVYISLLGEYETCGEKYAAYIAALQVSSYFPGGYLVINHDNELLHIIEKPAEGEEPSDLINIVVHLHAKPGLLFEYLRKTASNADDVYEKALENMIRDGYKSKAVKYNGPWQSIKYPWNILDAMDYFAGSIKTAISPTCTIASGVSIDGAVIIEDNVRILENAVIRGPTFIGENTIIGNNALVRGACIGRTGVIGYGTEIKHSYIGDNCWILTNYIGDSVIDNNCAFGSCAVTANYRLDERNIIVWVGDKKVNTGRDKLGVMVGEGCRLGVNASLMPGTRLGANSFVGAHVCLTKDLDEGKMAIVKSDYIVLPNRFRLADKNRQALFKKVRR